MRLLLNRPGDTYRTIAKQLGVSLGSISNIKKRLLAHRFKIVQSSAPPIALIDEALKDRKRVGGAAKRKIVASAEHASFLIDLLEKADSRLQLSELCQLFKARFNVTVAVSRP